MRATNRAFKNKHVVVTGGTGALGTSVVGALLEQGATVSVPVAVASEVERFPFADRVRIEVGIDLSSEESAVAFFDAVGSDGLWASIHIAGGFAMSPLRQTPLDAFHHMMRMNATTAFLSCREAAKKMGADGGRIVNVAAKPALQPVAGMAPYAASKAAVVSLTQCLAEELSVDGIWVNAVVPSIMDTPANRAGMPDADHAAWPSTVDVAATIVFLASPLNAATRGALVPVYGRS